MTIEKLPSGHYRITKMVKGKRYRATLDHKPTKAEAEEVITELVSQSKTYSRTDMTFRKAAEGYLELKSNVLSPSTRVAYDSILRNMSEGFLETMLNDIDMVTVQGEINRKARTCSPKTLSNVRSFISSVMGMYRPAFSFKATIPMKQKVEYITPTPEMVRNVLEQAEGTEYHIPFSLAVLSVRRSEICALEMSDLDGNMLHIHRAKVEDLVDGRRIWLVKEYPKTTESNRTIYLPDDLVALIHEKEYFFKYLPPALVKALHRFQDKLGYPYFRLHDFRHYYASYAHSIGIPDKYIQKQGGWKTDNVMKRVYSHAFEDEFEEISKEMANRIL